MKLIVLGAVGGTELRSEFVVSPLRCFPRVS
jgi:hypothetical protein